MASAKADGMHFPPMHSSAARKVATVLLRLAERHPATPNDTTVEQSNVGMRTKLSFKIETHAVEFQNHQNIRCWKNFLSVEMGKNQRKSSCG